jgi:hypothetical protein
LRFGAQLHCYIRDKRYWMREINAGEEMGKKNLNASET